MVQHIQVIIATGQAKKMHAIPINFDRALLLELHFYFIFILKCPL